MRRRALLGLGAALAAMAVLVAATGGVRTSIGGYRVSARSPATPAAAAAACFLAWAAAARRRRRMAADLDEAWAAVSSAAPAVVLAIGVASAGVAAWFGAFVSAGADQSGYLSQAALWASGRIEYADPLASLEAVRANPWLTTPLGWRPGGAPGVQVPTYAPGLPWLMAVPRALGGPRAAALVPIVSAGVAVWATGALAARLAGGAAGIVAAALLAAAPIFLFQSVQAMSDVPVTAAWAMAWLLAARAGERPSTGAALGAGVAAAAAVLIRPNLAPLAAVPLVVVWTARKGGARAAAAFSLPVAAAGALLSWLNWRWYGSPVASGYGAAGDLFAWSNIGGNLSRYASWLRETSPVLWLAPAGLWCLRRRRAAWGMAVFSVLVACAYLLYGVFDDWSYLRFLLPALAVSAVMVGAAAGGVVERMPSAWRATVVATVLLGALAHGVAQARTRGAFDLRVGLGRVTALCAALDRRARPGAVVVAGEQSGAVRDCTGRSIVRWDVASAAELGGVLDELAASEREIWVALDAWEEPLYRQRMGGIERAALDWPPAIEAGDTARARAWRLADRERDLSGERVTTERVR